MCLLFLFGGNRIENPKLSRRFCRDAFIELEPDFYGWFFPNKIALFGLVIYCFSHTVEVENACIGKATSIGDIPHFSLNHNYGKGTPSVIELH